MVDVWTSFEVIFDDTFCLNSSCARFVLLGNSEFEFAKFDFLVGQTRIVIHIDRFDSFSTFLKDRDSQDFVFSGDSVAMQVCKFHKDRTGVLRIHMGSLCARADYHFDSFSEEIVHCAGAGCRFQPYSFSPYCLHQVGAGDCQQYSFLPYCSHRIVYRWYYGDAGVPIS